MQRAVWRHVIFRIPHTQKEEPTALFIQTDVLKVSIFELYRIYSRYTSGHQHVSAAATSLVRTTLLCCESLSDSVWLVSMAATVQFCRAAVPGDDGGEVRSLRIFSELGCGETEIYIDRLDLAPIKSNGLATYL